MGRGNVHLETDALHHGGEGGLIVVPLQQELLTHLKKKNIDKNRIYMVDYSEADISLSINFFDKLFISCKFQLFGIYIYIYILYIYPMSPPVKYIYI